MDSSEDMAARIMTAISSLPLAEQEEAVHGILNEAMKVLPYAGVVEMRAAIAGQFPDALDLPIVESSLSLIDGHLILRELGEIDEPNTNLPPSP